MRRSRASLFLSIIERFINIDVDKHVDKLLITKWGQSLHLTDYFLILEAYSTAICFDLNH